VIVLNTRLSPSVSENNVLTIDGVEIGDLAKLIEKVIVAGHHQISGNDDEYLSTEITVLGTRICYEHCGGPVITRHTLRGKGWNWWVELYNATISVTDGETRAFFLKTNRGVYLRYNDRFHSLYDHEFNGDSFYFKNDLTVMRLAGLI
jgi:hypothetical protein